METGKMIDDQLANIDALNNTVQSEELSEESVQSESLSSEDDLNIWYYCYCKILIDFQLYYFKLINMSAANQMDF
mgnify:CR=1 FL=1